MNYWMIFLLFVPLGVLVFGRSLSAVYPENLSVLRFLPVDILGLRGFGSYNITWWFNKLILILYILSPVVYIFTKQIPIGTIIMVFCMQRFGILDDTFYLELYLMPFVIGFVWAQNAEAIEKKITPMSQWLGAIIALVLVGITTYCRQKSFIFGSWEWDTYLAVAISLLVVVLNSRFNYTRIVLGYLGKHSMNIYMTHTFVFYYFWHEEIYSLGNPWLILAVVLGICLVFSMVLEFAKEKNHFYEVPDLIIEKYQNMKERLNRK